jgi:hypothetical protein
METGLIYGTYLSISMYFVLFVHFPSTSPPLPLPSPSLCFTLFIVNSTLYASESGEIIEVSLEDFTASYTNKTFIDYFYRGAYNANKNIITGVLLTNGNVFFLLFALILNFFICLFIYF